MNELFAKTHWIVPLSNYVPTAAEERESELREGKIRVNGQVQTIGGHDGSSSGDKSDEKARSLEIEHSDRMA
jgi:hypothetical protein